MCVCAENYNSGTFPEYCSFCFGNPTALFWSFRGGLCFNLHFQRESSDVGLCDFELRQEQFSHSLVAKTKPKFLQRVCVCVVVRGLSCTVAVGCTSLWKRCCLSASCISSHFMFPRMIQRCSVPQEPCIIYL